MKSSPPYFSDLYHSFILIINILFLFLPHIIINIIIYINLIFLYFFFIINFFKIKNIISIFFITGWNAASYNFGKRSIGTHESPWLASIEIFGPQRYNENLVPYR